MYDEILKQGSKIVFCLHRAEPLVNFGGQLEPLINTVTEQMLMLMYALAGGFEPEGV